MTLSAVIWFSTGEAYAIHREGNADEEIYRHRGLAVHADQQRIRSDFGE